jgi:MFS transporter, SET family, sugar efflux transporter
MTATAAPALTLRRRSRALAPLGLVFLTVGVATAFAFPFLTLFLTSAVHASPLEITVFLLAQPLSGVIVSSALARVSDRGMARRRIMMIAAAAGCVATCLNSVVRSYPLLLLIACTLTATATAALSQGFAYAREVLAGDPAAAMATSALRTCFSLSWVAGPPLASVLLGVGGFRLLYGSAAALWVIMLVVVLTWLRNPVRLTSPDGELHDPLLRTPDASPRALWLTLAALVLLQGSISLNVQAVPLLVRNNLHAGVSAAGIVLGVCAALEIPAMLGFGALSTRIKLGTLVRTGPLFGAAYYLMTAATTQVWQLDTVQVVNACYIAIMQGLSISYVQELLPSQPGRASTLYGNTFALGAIVASPLLGLGAQFGYRTTYLGAVGLAAVGLALLVAGRVSASEGGRQTADARLGVT